MHPPFASHAKDQAVTIRYGTRRLAEQCVVIGTCPSQDVKVYSKLRLERMNERMVGPRLKKAKEAAKEAEANA